MVRVQTSACTCLSINHLKLHFGTHLCFIQSVFTAALLTLNIVHRYPAENLLCIQEHSFQMDFPLPIFFFNCNTHVNENERHLTLSSFRSFSAGSSISGQGKKPGNGVNGLAFGLHAPEKAPMRLLMLRREEITCGGRVGSLRSSASMFRASFRTERSIPVPLPALWNRRKCCKLLTRQNTSWDSLF